MLTYLIGMLHPQVLTIIVSLLTSAGAMVLKYVIDWKVYGPKLKVRFERSRCVFVTKTAPANNEAGFNPSEIYFRLEVINTGRKTLRRCSAWLIGIERLESGDLFQRTIYRDTLPLAWSYDDSSVEADLPPHVPRHLDVAYAERGIEGLNPMFRGRHIPPHYQQLFDGFGAWKLTVLVSGEDIHPATKSIIVRHYKTELDAEGFDGPDRRRVESLDAE